MSAPKEEHPTAAFADQVQPGMRVGHPDAENSMGCWPEPVLITQVRAVTASMFGEESHTVHFLGVHDDGRPFHYMAGPQMAVLIYQAPLTESPSTREESR